MTPITILYLTANPSEVPRLNLDREIREITEKIRLSEHRAALKVEPGWAVRPEDLLQYLNLYKPTIVHFSGHGSTGGELILVDRQGNANPIAPDALAALFLALKDNIRVVLLNACYSVRQATAITEVVDCAIGVSSEIGDDAAIEFAASFYNAIGFGRSVQEAFDIGLALLKLEGVSPDQYPQLHVKSGVDAGAITLTQTGSDQEARPTEDSAQLIESNQNDQLLPKGRSKSPVQVKPSSDALYDFRLTRMLQENPRSAIYRAVRITDGRPVLIKKIKEKSWYRPESIREITKLYARNPTQLTVALPLSILEDDSNFYEVLEHYEGWTLGGIVGRNLTGICGSLFEEWMRDLLYLLFPLHQHGFVHGDISPYNILLKSDNLQLVLLDFSNAHPVFSIPDESPFFTPGFSAPELHSGAYSYASDLYSVGAVLYFLNSCRIPPSAEERVYKQREIALREVSYHKVVTAVDKMLAMAPTDRFEDAIDALQAIQRTGTTQRFMREVLGQFFLPDGTKLVMSTHNWKRVPASEHVIELSWP